MCFIVLTCKYRCTLFAIFRPVECWFAIFMSDCRKFYFLCTLMFFLIRIFCCCYINIFTTFFTCCLCRSCFIFSSCYCFCFCNFSITSATFECYRSCMIIIPCKCRNIIMCCTSCYCFFFFSSIFLTSYS